jgi:hypothetical protein
MVVPRALRANYDRQPRAGFGSSLAQRTDDAPRNEKAAAGLRSAGMPHPGGWTFVGPRALRPLRPGRQTRSFGYE